MKIFLVLAAIFLIMAVVGLVYFFRKVLGAVRCFLPGLTKTKQMLLSTGIFVLAILPAFFSLVAWFIIIMHFIAFLALADLAALIAKKAARGKTVHYPEWLKIAYRSGAAAFALTILVCGYAKYNMYHVVRTEYDVSIDKQLSQEFNIAMIADLHYGISLDAGQLQAVADSIGKEKPDAVILCGDLVDESSTPEGMREAFSILGGIESRYGVYYVYGNHDKSRLGELAGFSNSQLTEAIEGSGITILEDQTVAFNEDVILAGRADKLNTGGNRKTVDEILGETDRTKVIIVADHQPSDYDSLEKAGCDLVLSGHTHGGQTFPLGFLNDLIHFSELNYGYKKQGHLNAVVTSGVAGWGYDMRTEHHSEYVVIHIKGR